MGPAKGDEDPSRGPEAPEELAALPGGCWGGGPGKAEKKES